MSEVIENATDEQIEELLQGKSDVVRQVYMKAHRLVLETLPDVAHATELKDGSTWYGTRQYGYDGWGMAALSAHAKWVSLALMHGADLQDPSGILEGTGKKMRHVKLRSLEQFEERQEAVRGLVQAASRLHES